ncbi:MAG: hypothetical protein FD180_4432 [Planctomycetota bacterium]|nr:MAG: hypothetical protein FD180_4432 [Planctomycetota bacterium]
MRLAAALFACASLAAADGVDDRLQAARVLLESDDPASRDRGEAELAAVAVEAGARLKPLLEHPDAEVRARVSNVLDREQVIPEDGKTARLRELFALLAKPGPADEERRRAVREILELHPRAAAFVARELGDGRLTGTPEKSRIVPTGRVAVDFEVENNGDCGAWIRRERWYVFPNLRPFGERPGFGGGMGGAAGGVISLRRGTDSAEDAMVRALAAMVRVPRGGRAVLVSTGSEQKRCGTLRLRAQAMGYSPRTLEAVFSGETLALPEMATTEGASATRFVLGEAKGKRFRAVPWEADGDRGLEVTALEDVAAGKIDQFDPFWWVALDAEGGLIEDGAFQTDEADLAGWKADETRRIRLRGGPPAATRLLWMGVTWGDDECVPAPVEVKE